LGQQAGNLKGPQAQLALAEIELESENARAAWIWAAEHQRVELLEQPMETFFLFYLWRRRYQEGEAACRLAAEHLEPVVSKDGLRVLARILMWHGSFGWRLGRIEFANRQLQRSLALLERLEAENLDVRPEKASVLLQMGHITFDVDLERAKGQSEQSLSLFRELDDSWGTANALSALGWAAMSGGDYSQARKLFEESLAIRQSLGDQRGIVDSFGGLCFTAFFHGQFEEAEAYMRESISFLQNVGVQADIFDDVLVAEAACDALDESATVHAPYQESLGFYSDIGFSHSYVATNSSLGYVKKHLGQYEEARLQARLGLMLGKEAGWRSEVALSLHLLGDLALVEEAYTEAHRCLSESLEILRETQILELSDSLASLGFAARGLRQISRAEQCLAEALQIASDIKTSLPLTTALPAIALLLADQGEKERAIELYALASRDPRVANSRWFEDVAGRHIADVAATFPSDVVAAAQERGKARNLEATVAELLTQLRR
jgi:tetratricopeptide (TPR) repeat protein